MAERWQGVARARNDLGGGFFEIDVGHWLLTFHLDINAMGVQRKEIKDIN